MGIQAIDIIAHRGASKEAPENTLSAFRLAVEQGAHAIELDIHLSADGQLVVCHDPTVNRTTNGKGRIFEMSYAEIEKLDAGSWFSESYANEKMPRLDDVLEWLPKYIWINIELKILPGYAARHVEKRLLEKLKEYDKLSKVVVSSFDSESLLRLYHLEPSLRMGLLYDQKWYKKRMHVGKLPAILYSIHPHKLRVNDRQLKEFQRRGLKIYPWTIDQSKELQRWMNHQPAGIITNVPSRLYSLLKGG